MNNGLHAGAGNPFITSSDRQEIVTKLKRYLSGMLDDQSPSNLLAQAPRIVDMAGRFEEQVWHATRSRDEYFQVIQTRVQSLQAQRKARDEEVARSQTAAAASVADIQEQQSKMAQVRQLLPSLDTLIKVHSGTPLRHEQVFTKILGIRTIAFKTLEAFAATGKCPMTSANCATLLLQMGNGVNILKGIPAAGAPAAEQAALRERAPPKERRPVVALPTSLPSPQAVGLVRTLVAEEVNDFLSAATPQTYRVEVIESPSDVATVIVGRSSGSEDLLRMSVSAWYPNEGVVLQEPKARLQYAFSGMTVTNVLHALQ